MSAPPGFNANDSLLPDPGANTAPIHVMRGGGRGGGRMKQAFGMFPGGPLAHIPPNVQDGFEREVEAFKEPGGKKSMVFINQVFRELNSAQKSYLRNLIQVYNAIAQRKQEQIELEEFRRNEANWQKTAANTERVLREGQYLIEARTGKLPNKNQPLDLATMIEENPANFSVGVVAGKPSAMRTNYTRNFPYSTNAVVGTRKLRISGKTPYYATKRYGAEMNALKSAAPITAAAALTNWGAASPVAQPVAPVVPEKKPGFFSRLKSWFSRKKGGRRRLKKRTVKRRSYK